MTSTGWTELAGLPAEVRTLVERCLAADGGLPLAADPGFLGRRWAGPNVTAFGLRSADGSLLAAGAVRLTPSGPAFTGLVDPAARGRGLGGDLLDHGLALTRLDTAPTGAHAAAPGVGGARAVAAGVSSARAAAPGADRARAVAPGAGAPGAHAAVPEASGAHAATSRASGVHAATSRASGVHAATPGASGAHAAASGAVGAHVAEPSSLGSHAADARTAEADAAGGLPEDGAAAESVVTVESETLTEDAVALFASRGLRQVFAEDVMRIDLTGTSTLRATWPAGATVVSWSGPVARRFHATYDASFRDRPGFPGDPADEWIAENEDDEDFLPDCSLLVTVPGLGDAGFITAARGWVVQVGVAASARRQGLAAALITESLARMRASGGTHAWLTVNVNNPGAAHLYRRLGFADRGRRARFQL